MENFKVGICETADFSPKAIAMLEEKGMQVVLRGEENVEDFIADKDAIFVRLGYHFDDETVKKAKRLKYICTPTTGLNHIQLMHSDIEILSLKSEAEFLSSIRATPEHVFGLTLALLRNYKGAFLTEENSEWCREKYKGYEVFQKKVGIIGMGRIGKLLSRYFNAFDAETFYYEIDPEKSDGNSVRCASLDELINRSDIIILEANYTPENDKMLGEKEFSMMNGKYFINAARGELVDENALLNAINKGTFSGVAIDVLSGETLGYPNLERFLELQKKYNLLITPHIGGATYTSMQRTEEFIAQKLIKNYIN